MLRSCLVLVLAGCGGSSKPAVTSGEIEHIDLEPTVAAQTWYRAPTICGQGPYEVELPVEGAKWGEEVVLQLAGPRGVSIHAVIDGDNDELAKAAGVFGGKAENTRCIADARERLAAVRSGSGGGTVVPNVPAGSTVVIPPPSPPVQLIVEEGIEPTGGIEVVRWRVREPRARRVRIRWWSVEPNDLEGVRFGVVRIVWRPNVSEAEYEAYLVREQQRRAANVESTEESHARWVRQNADAQRQLAEERERDRKRAIKAALEAERRRRFDAYCAAHHESRDCWGAGGKRGWAELQDRVRQREGYCATNGEDARCWSAAERARRERAWSQRISDASAPPKQPEGPPPAPRDETPPPKLSDNAEWRPGYWLWTGTTWIWLTGMWRVPDADIVAEKTTTAPVAPPPPQVEPVPPPPMPATIWVSGFWQWDGRGYIWVPGSYQARPETGMSWRPTEWRARGRVHVLVPGGWVRVR